MSDTVGPVIEEGALARLNKAVSIKGRNWRQGTEFLVQDYVPADEAEDGQAFYWGNQGEGNFNNVWFLAADVEQVKTAKQMNDRTTPTPAQIAQALASALGGTTDIGFIHEADYSSRDGLVEFSATTDDGLEYWFSVRVAAVGRAS